MIFDHHRLFLAVLKVEGAGGCYCHPPANAPDPCSLCPANCPCYTSTDIWNEIEALSTGGAGDDSDDTCISFSTVEFDARNDCYCRPTNGDCDSCPAACRCDTILTVAEETQSERVSRANAVMSPIDSDNGSYDELIKAIYLVGTATAGLLMMIVACLCYANCCRGDVSRGRFSKLGMVDSSEDVGLRDEI